MDETKDLFTIFCLMGLWFVAVNCDLSENSIVFTTNSNSTYVLDNTEEWIQGDAKALTLIRRYTSMEKGSGLAYDFHLQELIFSDPGKNAIYVLDSTSFVGIVYHLGTSNGVGQMSVDWLGHNIYWTDSVYGWIAMQKLPEDISRHNSLETSFRLVVEKYLHTPTGIAVHPHKHYLFWADAGPQPKIERSDLIGGERSIIIWAGLIQPTTLCIDQSTDKLFWTDSSRGTVEYSDFDGLLRNILISNSLQDYYGIAVFKDSIIVTVPSLYNVELYEKATGELTTRSHYGVEPFYSAIVYNPEDQPRQKSEGCDDFDCDHICTHMPMDRGYTCLCDDGYELELDGITCTAHDNVLERFILLTNGTTICGISINAINIFHHSLHNPICGIVSHKKEITKFALDMKNNTIFYTDGEDIFQDTAFGQNPEHIGSADEVSDLDYNWKTGELIWTDKADGKIYALNINVHDGEEREIVEDLTHPSSIAVDPHDRRIYWVSKEDLFPKLHVMDDDGSVSVVGTSFLNDPNDLEYDRLNERLLWSDRRGHIGMINVDGSNERKIEVVNKQPEALSVFKKYIICSDDTADMDILTVTQEPENTQWVVQNTLLGSTYAADVHVFDSYLQLSDLEPCEENNGGCEQLCLPQENNRCACDLGYDLDTDGTSCITTISDENFYIVTDTLYKAIYQLDTDGENIHVIEIEKDNDPTSVSFDSGENILYWIDSRSKSLKMKDMHSTRETSLGIDVSEHSSIAVDVTGGNAYVTTADKILLFTPSNDVKTLLEGSDLKGQPGKVALKPSAGVMVWVETGASTRIVKANMDGTTMKEVVNDNINTPTDIVIDHSVDNANIMYWSDSGLHKIEKVDLDSLSPSAVYQNQELEITAIDVKDNYLFFIAEGHRKIIRIDKNSGSGYLVVKESALLGQLSTLYVWKPAPPKHDSCSGCTNGGCSAICLPRRDGRTCACADGISLGSDDKTCNNVDRCDTEVSITNIKSLDPCCVPISNRICDYTCKAGYQRQPYSLLCKANGRWNMSLTDACMKVVLTTPLPIVATASSSSVGIYAGIGGGVAAILVLGIVLFVVYRRKKNNQIKRQRLTSIPSIGDVNPSGGSLNSQSPLYNDSMFRPDLPPRGLTPEEEADGGQYWFLDEAAMNAKFVDLPPEGKEKDTHPGIEKGSQPSDRYSKFPQRQSDYTVLNPQRDSEYLCPYPAPDFDTDYQEEGVRLPFEDKQRQKYPEGGDTYLHGVSFSKKPSFPNLPQKGPEHINHIKLPTQNGTTSGSRQKSADLDDSGYMVAAATGSSRKYGNPGYMTGFITKDDSMIPPADFAPIPPTALARDSREDRFGDSRL